jgi:hypothetical protein
VKQPNDSRAKIHPGEASNTWDLKGVTLFRALGYVVGLPSFIVGTAVFMLGFALMDADILNIACILYSLALIAIGGRPVLLWLNPQNERQALKLAILLSLLTVLGFNMFI